MAGIEDKLTDSAMYVVALKELMSQAIPGKFPRQAPRFPTILLAAFEDMVLCSFIVALGAVLGYFVVRRSSRAAASRLRRDFYWTASQAHQV